MIHAKAPLRISFCGGGTDHRRFYEKHGGCVLSAAIKKYAHCVIDRPTSDLFVVDGCGVYGYTQMRYWTDLPPGSGLGGSSAVAVACIAAEDRRHSIERSREDTLAAAETLERGHLRMAGGSQDYYPAVYGGCNLIAWRPLYTPGLYKLLKIGTSSSVKDDNELAKWLLLVRTDEAGDQRRMLAKQKDADIVENANVQAAMIEMKQLTRDMYQAANEYQYMRFGELLAEAWKLKKDTSPHCSTERIEMLLRCAERNGSLGGKLCGVSTSHLLLCASPDTHSKLSAALTEKGCVCEAVEFDHQGLTVEERL